MFNHSYSHRLPAVINYDLKCPWNIENFQQQKIAYVTYWGTYRLPKKMSANFVTPFYKKMHLLLVG